jgi:preprotein translocase subunit SecD
MKKRYRFLLVLILLAIGFWFLWPSIRWYFLVPQADKEIAESSRNRIKEYSQDEAITAVDRMLALPAGDPLPTEFSYLAAEAKNRYRSAGKPVPAQWTMGEVLSAWTGRKDFQAAVEEQYRTYFNTLKNLRSRTLQLGLDLRGGMYVVIQADFAALEQSLRAAMPEAERAAAKPLTEAEREDYMSRALEVLNNRIDQFGLTEPSIRRQGSDQIIVEIPGTSDPEAVRRFIMGKGLLTFHIADTDALASVREYEKASNTVLLDAAGSVRDQKVLELLPKGTMLRGVFKKDAYGIDEYKGYAVLREEVGLNGTYIRDAQVSRDNLTGQPVVNFLLTSEGGEIFYKLTSANVGKVLAVVLDNKIKAQATIRTSIRDQVQVEGFEADEAADLALVLRTGALPIPLTIISQQAIGASLGEDAIRQGINASLLGLGLVILFMMIYYRRAGLNAVVAQILNLYFIVAILSAFNFTLTLAAIAGLVLTVGMAVDASVLIFERMKEEMRLGKSNTAVVKAGFDRAFWAIADSNITTFIAALVMSFFGKSSIKGFAVTLAVGIVSSMFTAVFVSRLIFDFNLEVMHIKHLRVSWRTTT